MVGHFVGYTANAAIGVSWQIIIVVIVFIGSLLPGWPCSPVGPCQGVLRLPHPVAGHGRNGRVGELAFNRNIQTAPS